MLYLFNVFAFFCKSQAKASAKQKNVLLLSIFLLEDDVVSMADSTITMDDIEGELFKIERIRDVLVRRESELRYMWVA